jgi:2-keto-3-deoxy-L-fuconate dehydrogenase
MFKLSNKSALVTGAASGIGEAIATLFAEAGANLWIADIDEIKGPAVAARLGARFIRADVSQEKDCRDMAGTAVKVDILVNNAGIGHVGNLLQTAVTDLDRLFAVNVRGTFNCCKMFVPGMLDRRSGSVINLASIAGIVAVRERLAYTMTKFAIVGMTGIGPLAYWCTVQLCLPGTSGDAFRNGST